MKPGEIVFAVFFWGALAYAALDYFWTPSESTDARAARHEKHAQTRARSAELDREECAIMLRAKAEMIPIEIERHTLYGGTDEDARILAMHSFDIEKKLCEEHGIPPSAAASKGDSRDECERHPGPYGC